MRADGTGILQSKEYQWGTLVGPPGLENHGTLFARETEEGSRVPPAQELPHELSVCPSAGSAAQHARPAHLADGNSHSRTSPIRFAARRPFDCLELPQRSPANWASPR